MWTSINSKHQLKEIIKTYNQMNQLNIYIIWYNDGCFWKKEHTNHFGITKTAFFPLIET